MKTFVIFVAEDERSRAYAAHTLRSLQQRRGWDPMLLPGVTPITLKLWKLIYPHFVRPGSRAESFKLQNNPAYAFKRSCWLNHMRVWQMAVDMDRPVAFIEHDSGCLADWDYPEFEDVLILNARPAVRQRAVQNGLAKHADPKDLANWPGIRTGVHDWDAPLIYRFSDDSIEPLIMPGTAAYAVTAQGARKLLEHAQHGWEQSDHYINTGVVRIQYRDPPYFDFHSANLGSSHGF